MSTATDDDKETRQNGSFAAKGFDSFALTKAVSSEPALRAHYLRLAVLFSWAGGQPAIVFWPCQPQKSAPARSKIFEAVGRLAQVEGPQEGRAARLLGRQHRTAGAAYGPKRVRVIPLWLRARSASACACRRETGSGASNNWAARARKKVPARGGQSWQSGVFVLEVVDRVEAALGKAVVAVPEHGVDFVILLHGSFVGLEDVLHVDHVVGGFAQVLEDPAPTAPIIAAPRAVASGASAVSTTDL